MLPGAAWHMALSWSESFDLSGHTLPCMNKPKVSVKILYQASVKSSLVVIKTLHGFWPNQLIDLTFGSITVNFHVDLLEVGECTPVNSNASHLNQLPNGWAVLSYKTEHIEVHKHIIL